MQAMAQRTERKATSGRSFNQQVAVGGDGPAILAGEGGTG